MHISFQPITFALHKNKTVMKIDFEYTWEHKGIIGYQNEKAETVKRYNYTEFEDWCIANKIDEGTDVAKYIDDNWVMLTTDFWNANNIGDFKSGNNTYPYAKEGIYNITPATKSK